MHFHSRSGSLHRISVLIAFLSFLAALAAPAELEPLYKPFPGQRDVGGCDQDLQNLEDSYSQAIDLCNVALEALGNIQEPRPEDAIEGQKWDRQARLAKAMWNLETDSTTGMTAKAMSSRTTRILST